MSEISDYGTGDRGKFAVREGEITKIKEPKKYVQASAAVHSDEYLDGIECLCGCDRTYQSKSQYMRHLKAQGYEVTGGDHLQDAQRAKPDEAAYEKQLEADIEKAYNDAKYGMAPLTEREKEQCKREQREMEQWKKRNWHRVRK